MEKIDLLPEMKISPSGPISEKFLALGIATFQKACRYVHQLEYGYNSDISDKMILFKEQKASCTMKHAVIAALAQELELKIHKNIMVYKFTEEITTGAWKINQKYGIPYTPLTHCFLIYNQQWIDLTEGNRNGKKKSTLEVGIHLEQVNPFISHKEEYLLYIKVLKEKILPSKEMDGISRKILVKAREEAIALLKRAIL